jgi:hypothetical protein
MALSQQVPLQQPSFFLSPGAGVRRAGFTCVVAERRYEHSGADVCHCQRRRVSFEVSQKFFVQSFKRFKTRQFKGDLRFILRIIRISQHLSPRMYLRIIPVRYDSREVVCEVFQSLN